jgi:hypothetical protein
MSDGATEDIGHARESRVLVGKFSIAAEAPPAISPGEAREQGGQ